MRCALETSRLNITLPEDLVNELNQLVEPRKKSRFIAAVLRDRLKKLREEKQKKILSEGYQTRKKESEEISQDYLSIDLEGWDEY
jgi:metal-responsive CopG/Arc/MetJ family transcriptional regulator